MKYRVKPATGSDGAGAGERGILYHRAITGAFRGRNKTRAAIDPEALVSELDKLEGAQPIDANLYRRGLLRRFLEQTLSGFAARESKYSGAFGTTATYFELAFGIPEGEKAESREYDPASRAEPLTLRSEDGSRSVALCGAIDRVDILNRNGAAMIMDYKTGATPDYKAIRSGSSLQMPIYMMALEALWGIKGAVGCYDSARESGRHRIFRTELAGCKEFGYQVGIDGNSNMIKPLNEEEYAAIRSAASEAVFRAVDKMLSFDIEPTPGEHCRYCAYSDICRTTTDSVHDGAPFDIMKEPGPPAEDLD
jgi:RecB family exonuclease